MAPTLGEIADHFGFASPTGVRDHLTALEKKGAIERDHGKARSLRVLPGVLPEKIPEGIPLIGKIAAGTPMEAIENCCDILPVPAQLFAGSGDLFALVVRGDSMINEGIQDGDLAILKKQSEIENGEIAAVLVDDEATLKKVYRDKTQLILRAANANYPDIVVTPAMRKTLRIAGRYVGLIRSEQSLESIVA